MNQTLANKLNEEGAIILCIDVPEETEIGLDYNVFYAGKQFLGFKMINPGFHCLFYSSVGKEKDTGLRSVIPLFLRSKEVRVFQWNRMEEKLLSEDQMDSDFVRRYKLAGGEFIYDKQTAAYPYETLAKWMNLSSYITYPLYSRFTDSSTPKYCLDDEGENLYHYTPTLNITSLVKQLHIKENMKQLSELYVDTSTELSKMLEEYADSSAYLALLGEFQFCFLMFSIGEDYSSFLQWKNILFLVSGAYSTITEEKGISVTSFYEHWITSFYLQITEISDDFFSLNNSMEMEKNAPKSVNRSNFVIKCLESFNSILLEHSESISKIVLDKLETIKSYIKRRFGIEIEALVDEPSIEYVY